MTSNLAFAEWTKVFGDAALTAAALLDRLTHHCQIYPFDWESIRSIGEPPTARQKAPKARSGRHCAVFGG